MRFQKDSAPPPYLNRRDQYRMLGLVGMLFLIIVAIDFTRKPENWAWFFPDQTPEQMELKELSLDDLDFSIEEPDLRSLPPDTFVAVTETPSTIDYDKLGLDIQRIPPTLLEGIQDKRVGLLRTEQEAMDSVLKRVRTLKQAELEAAAIKDVGFRVVFTDADKHRGELIHLEGTLWRLQKYPFGDPSTEDDDLWQAWMFSSDSGNNPWVVFLVDKPDGIEAHEGVNREVSLAGYFFKNYGYATEQGLHIAPMLIAKSFRLKPLPVATDAKAENLSLYVFIFLMTIGLLFGVMIWWFVRSDRKFDKSHMAEIAEARHDVSPEFVASLSDLSAHDPNKLRLPDTEQSTK